MERQQRCSRLGLQGVRGLCGILSAGGASRREQPALQCTTLLEWLGVRQRQKTSPHSLYRLYSQLTCEKADLERGLLGVPGCPGLRPGAPVYSYAVAASTVLGAPFSAGVWEIS